MIKRLYDLMQYNPGVALANQLRKAIFGAFGAGEDKFTVEDLFGQGFDFKFGTGLGDKPLPTGGEDDEDDKKKKMRTASKEMLALAEQRNQADKDRNFLQVALLDYAIRTQEVTEQFNAGQINFELAKKKNLEDEQRLRKQILKLRKDEKNEIAKLFNGQDEVNKKLTEAEMLGQNIVTTFAQGMGNALISLIDKATSFRDVMSDLLKQIGKMLISFGMQALGKGIFPQLFPQALGGVMSGNGPVPLRKYARGGIAYGPQMALFGEGSTPEAYVPLPDGRSIPVKVKDGGSMGNITVNVDASGSQVQGDQPNANKLGEALGAAVRQELIRQKRPGGLLS